MNKQIKKLVFCAIMIALATVLNMIRVVQMPLGGEITLLSMLPIAVMSITLGIGWGLGGAFVYSLIQFVFGIAVDGLFAWGLGPVQLIACIVLDYLFAFTALGLAGLFRNRKHGAVYGTALALFTRFLCHLASGYIIFANFEKFVVFGHSFMDKPLLYSICYNGTFMLPELIITCFAVFVISKTKLFDRMKIS